MSDSAFAQMKGHDWPGNIRELWSAVLRLAADETMGRTCTEWSRGGITKENLIDALKANSGNRTTVAKLFRVSARTIVRRAEKFGIDLVSFWREPG